MILGKLKLMASGALAILIGALFFVISLKSRKIESLEKDVLIHKANEESLEGALDAQKADSDLMEVSNEIHEANDTAGPDDILEQLRDKYQRD